MRDPGLGGRDTTYNMNPVRNLNKNYYKRKNNYISTGVKEERNYYVYILASKRNGTLYIGVTNNLFNRSFQHKIKENKNSFTAKYNINKLVYYEIFADIREAIAREKQLKRWKRKWKIELIEKDNPTWRDLFDDL